MIIFFLDNYFRNKSMLFWIIVFPTLFYLTFSTIFYKLGEDFKPKMEADIPKILFNILKDHFDIAQIQDENKIIQDVKNGTADCGIVLKGGKFVVYYTSRTTSSIAKDMLEGFFSTFSFGGREIKIKVIETQEKRLSSYEFYFPAGVLMVILGVGFFGAIYTETEIREKGIHKLFKILPRKKLPIDVMMFLSHFFAMLVSLSVLVAVSTIMGVNVNYKNLAFSVLFGAIIFIPLGIGIGKVSGKRSELVANLLYFPMLFLSGAFFGVSLKYNPATTIVKMIRGEIEFSQIILWVVISFIIHIAGSEWYAKAE